jgi:hypothetical protein
MKKYNITDIFIYHDYLVAAFTDGTWEVICPTYRCLAHGKTPDARSAVAAAKTKIDIWLDRVKKQQQEQD